jgi:transcriptional regulator with XRE-family HTH domain
MTAPLTQIVASGVRAEMARRGLSQQQLADKAGISQQTLSRRIRIDSPTPFDTDELERVAAALDVPVEQLLATPVATA